jgi:ABC-type nickel/cobalt efflux system permease component RcnA
VRESCSKVRRGASLQVRSIVPLNLWCLMRWRPLIAFALLLGYGATSVEAVLGEVRDGDVHHESSAEALDHTQSSQGEHGHEDAGENPEHGSDHRHGTSGDHCTHTHSASLVAASHGFVVVAFLESVYAPAAPMRSDTFVGPLFHPPKA